MNFEWANKIAKNALKSAQKRIDSVLDIEAEDEEEVRFFLSDLFVVPIRFLISFIY